MIANSLPGLVKEKTGAQSKPIQPGNIGKLYVERDEVKNIVRAALNQSSKPKIRTRDLKGLTYRWLGRSRVVRLG
jgi:hypothetical protein